jgi:hypothetical protein
VNISEARVLFSIYAIISHVVHLTEW